MPIDTRTDAERRYDAERDGSLYRNQAPADDYAQRVAAGYADGRAIGQALATPELNDRFLTMMEQVVKLPQAERDEFFDTYLDVVDPLERPRPCADQARVAELRREFAELLA